MKPLVLFVFFICMPMATVHADTLSLGDTRYDGVINGIKNGKASITIRGQEHPCELSDVTGVFLDEAPKLADAEAARSNDPKKSAAIYKQVIQTINKPDLKLLIEWRTIDPTDRDARWSEAVALFLDVYQAAPTDAIWNGRPTHWPVPGSSMLEDGARRVNAAIKDAKSEDVKKKLRTYLLDIYTKAGDTAAAQRVAHEIETGIAQEPVAAASQQVPAATAELAASLAAKNYDAALKQADARLSNATGENAVELYAIKAQALEGLNKFHEAAGAWLRIFAHYPASPAAPDALLNAARLEKKLNNPAAKIIFDEILQKYPASKEAALVPQEK